MNQNGDDSTAADSDGASSKPTAPLTDSASAETQAHAQTHGNEPAEPRLTRLGHYSLIRIIDEGGMGTVYEAIQDKPRRTVAVKRMHHGLTSRAALRRFDTESQMLARLRHPAIAQVYEAGTDRQGHVDVPYFAMEYIPGAKPITDYAREKNLSVRERLELFIQVCDAVQHAHEKSILHRDLKPQNILVDLNGRPKVIDFGIARAIDADQVPASLQTSPDQLLGTLQYMSPEQLDGDPRELDARADVYALGVVLYELLCGQLPFDLTRSRLTEASRVLKEKQPPRPSVVNPSLGEDLETVILTALHKDRAKRYQSAGELAGDLRCVLTDGPILARRDSVIYVLRRQLAAFARRHRLATAMLAMLIAIIVAVFGGGSLDDRVGITRRVEGALIRHFSADPGPTLVGVSIIANTDVEEMTKLATVLHVSPASPQDRSWTRAGRSVLLSRLAKADPRVVVMDHYAPAAAADPEADRLLVNAIDLLTTKGIDVVHGVASWQLRPDGGAELAKTLMPYVRWGVIGGTMSEKEAWSVQLALQHEGADPLPSLPLTTFAAARRPRATATFAILPIANVVEVHYGPTADPTLPGDDNIDVTNVEHPVKNQERYGIRKSDLAASYVVPMPSNEVLAASTIAVREVLSADDATLQKLFSGKVVIIGDELPGIDQHDYIDGRKLFGLELHAVAIDSLLNNRGVRRPPMFSAAGMTLSARVPVDVLAALTGGLSALCLGKRYHWYLLAALVCVLVASLSILIYRQYNILYSPFVPLLALFISYEFARLPHSLEQRDLRQTGIHSSQGELGHI